MLAYSSVEHMGLLALGAGLGGAGGFAALLHAGNHTMAKGMLFLTAGNILTFARTKSVDEATGLRARLPVTAAALDRRPAGHHGHAARSDSL